VIRQAESPAKKTDSTGKKEDMSDERHNGHAQLQILEEDMYGRVTENGLCKMCTRKRCSEDK
jgi:hypothetical protein